MKQAVAYLMPFMEKERRRPALAILRAGKVLMATVKGDVHDIGKNIVGVVLQCNNYEVIDLGVMVPAQKILDTAKTRRSTSSGCPGSSRPRSTRWRMSRPRWSARASTSRCSSAGATTSRVHTAVKIHPNYKAGQAVHVNDASRAVGVVSALLSDGQGPYIDQVRAEYRKVADAHARSEADKQRVPIAAARANR
jgi:5-methyltetrahydrofolate--homocysteine methyltransferase